MRASIVALALVAAAATAHAGALESLADGLTADAKGAAKGHVALRVRGGAGELAATVEGLMRARLARQTGVRSVGRAEELVEARRDGFDTWVEVDLRLEAGLVVAVGKVMPASRDLWRELVGGGEPPGGIAATLFAEVPVSAEVRAQLGPAPPPRQVPVKAAPRRWSFRQLKAPLDLGAPILALAAADVDGDGRAELIALTTGEVVILDVDGAGARIDKRIALGGMVPVPRPRFPVGTLVVADLTGDGAPEIAARSSEREAGAIWSAQSGSWTSIGPVAGYPLCALAGRLGAAPLDRGVPRFRRDGASWTQGAAPSWWGTLIDPFAGLTCTPLGADSALAVLDLGGVLRISTASGTSTVSDCGTAFAVADLDGDGRAEVVTSANRAPGDGDQLTIWALPPGAEPRPLHRTPPLKGGVTGVAAGDFDADGTLDALAAVRMVGSTQVDLWVLE